MNLVNLVSVVSIILLGLLLFIFTVLLPVAIVFNTRSGMKYRQALAEQLDHLRLGKMLKALGIDRDSYLSSERVVDIHEQMERCSACANTEKCDNATGRRNRGCRHYRLLQQRSITAENCQAAQGLMPAATGLK